MGAAETLYRPKGAGHDAPGARRKYIWPRDRLLGAFGRWLDWSPEGTHIMWECDTEKYYQKAVELMSGLAGASQEETSALLMPFFDHPRIQYGGMFLSAAYNLSPLQDFTFDDDVELELQKEWDWNRIGFLGYRLGKGKTLVITGGTGERTGWECEGIIINRASSVALGNRSTGKIVNYGDAGRLEGFSRGTLINCGKAGKFDGAYPELAADFNSDDRTQEYKNKNGITLLTGRETPGKPPGPGLLYKVGGFKIPSTEWHMIRGLREYIESTRSFFMGNPTDQELVAWLRGHDMKRDIERLIHGMEWEEDPLSPFPNGKRLKRCRE